MKILNTLSKTRLLQRLGFITGTLLALMFLSGTVLANTAANNIIRNMVTVDYDDAGGNSQTAITAQVDITVNLVESTPTLSSPVDISTDAGTAAVYNYTLTATANGPDTYDLSAAITAESAGINSSTVATSVTSLDLGATTVATGVTLNAASNTVITVPSDGANDGFVNGLTDLDSVVIGGFTYSVVSVDDSNGGLPGTSTITVSFDGNTPALLVGDVIGELGTFTLTVTPGTVTDATTDQTVTVNVSAIDDAGVGPATTADGTITTVTAIALAVTKYVANITNPIAGGGTPLNVDTGGGAGLIDYYISGVSGNPGDTLEYVIQVENPTASSTASNVRISDPVPAFTTYTAGTIRLDDGGGVWAGALDADADADAGEFGSNTVYIYVGTGGTDGAAGVGNGTGGSLAVSTTTLGSFRVTIDN